MPNATAQTCFVDMPFGEKTEPHSGVTIDFDDIYVRAIEPAITAAGLQPVRGDREATGGIIHEAMFARLLLSEFVVADMTTANANVFYELGVRHAARKYTTIPIFATVSAPPFDVGLVRAIPYKLKKGKLTKKAAAALHDAIKKRIDDALAEQVAPDSPLFQLFDKFPGIEMSHELTDVFQDRVKAADAFQATLDIALQTDPPEEVVPRLRRVQEDLGDLHTLTAEILMKLYLAYRGVDAHDEMLMLFDRFPAELQESTIARQQRAFALNRRQDPGDRDHAIRILEDIEENHGPSAETLGLHGRIYKDLYREQCDESPAMAPASLDRAIELYTRGFESEPDDYYPGVNAITLLIEKGTPAAMAEAERLTPLVSFAVARRGGPTSTDYWDLATVLELAAIGRDDAAMIEVRPRVLAAAYQRFMPNTTADNLELLLARRGDDEDTTDLAETIALLRERAVELPGG